MDLSKLSPKFQKAKNKKKLKESVGKFVVEKINEYLDGSKSPVSGGKYKAFKKDKSPSQLFDTGDMRSEIESKPAPNGINYGVYDDSETGKAFGHNSGFKGHPTIKQGKYTRKFIPDQGEILKKPILDGIKRIINSEAEV